jgi:hypothetical protein
MKKWVLLSLAVIAVFFVYFKFIRVGPDKAFEEFATCWGANRLEKAWAYSVREEVQEDFKNVNQVTGNMMSQIMGFTYAQTSRTEGPDGVDFTADLAVLFIPPGVESAMMPTHGAAITIEGTVRKTDAGWKVVAFYPELKGIREFERPR